MHCYRISAQWNGKRILSISWLPRICIVNVVLSSFSIALWLTQPEIIIPLLMTDRHHDWHCWKLFLRSRKHASSLVNIIVTGQGC